MFLLGGSTASKIIDHVQQSGSRKKNRRKLGCSTRISRSEGRKTFLEPQKEFNPQKGSSKFGMKMMGVKRLWIG